MLKKILILGLTLLSLNNNARAKTDKAIDLAPAKWIWCPSERTLQNTFVLFRKEFHVDKDINVAKGFIIADSRYLLYVNGQRVQWGPAPSDPRWQEADPVDLKPYLKQGKNVIAVQVCFFGTGDGTHPIGKPGLIFNAEIDGKKIVTDNSWLCYLARSWKPGNYKRWFLRALQEDFDARNYPYGWNDINFTPDNLWIKSKETSEAGNIPSTCSWSSEYIWEIGGNHKLSEIRERSIPMMKEYNMPVWKLTESMSIDWKRPVDDYFDMVIPGCYTEDKIPIVEPTTNNTYVVNPNGNKAASLIFEFKEQGVGWPYFTIDAPEGTIIELLVHEAHKPGGPAIINSHFYAWTRFTCKEGLNNFETFDFESFRWIQLHVRNFNRPITISNVGMRRRIYPWENIPQIKLSDDTLQRVMEATVNTLNNCAQETMVDGMARERQQYSGDGSHQMHPVFQAFGTSALPNRFVNTFSQGSSIEGFFMDSWPGWDRLARIVERQLDMTGWGPILDHGIGFCFDSHHYYMYTGDKKGLEEVYPRLMKFFRYMVSITDTSEFLIPSENLGMPSVYIDHFSYKKQKHKQLALNLYMSAMCKNALAPLCRTFNDNEAAAEVEAYGEKILAASVKKFWSNEKKIFINNLPWVEEEKEERYCDRSLATAIMYNQFPDNQYQNSLNMLINCPENMGYSYPCNAVWRIWALIEKGRNDLVLNDLRTRWAKMPSVWENNVLQEFWTASYDEHSSQWSHCAVGPLVALYQGVAGVVPLTPGSVKCKIRPQPGDLKYTKFDIQTVKGAINFESKGVMGKREINLEIPQGCEIELWLDARENINLPLTGIDNNTGLKKYKLTESIKLKLKFT